MGSLLDFVTSFVVSGFTFGCTVIFAVVCGSSDDTIGCTMAVFVVSGIIVTFAVGVGAMGCTIFGLTVGFSVGFFVGFNVGFFVGAFIGLDVGLSVGGGIVGVGVVTKASTSNELTINDCPGSFPAKYTLRPPDVGNDWNSHC